MPLRGRKVVVAMTGNPHTEIATKFRLPDTLANSADIYSLDGKTECFKANHIENVTSDAPPASALSLVNRPIPETLEELCQDLLTDPCPVA